MTKFYSTNQLGNSKFKLLYEPLETDFELSSFGITAPNHFRALIIPWWKIEHDFELSSFGITAPNHFRALIIPWLKIQTDIERYLITDHRSGVHFELPSFWITARNHFRALIRPASPILIFLIEIISSISAHNSFRSQIFAKLLPSQQHSRQFLYIARRISRARTALRFDLEWPGAVYFRKKGGGVTLRSKLLYPPPSLKVKRGRYNWRGGGLMFFFQSYGGNFSLGW